MTFARREFLKRVPAAQGRPFLEADRSVLQAAVELHEIGAALEIARLRAIPIPALATQGPLVT